MNKFTITVIAAALALAFNGEALAAQAISKEAYKAGQDKIASEYKSAKAACDSLKANAKDVCVAEAQGKQKVAKAELEADYKPGDKARYNVSLAKADAEYSLAKEKCDDKAGADKDACVKEAKAVEARAKADAKAAMKPAVASKPAKAAAAPATSKAAKPGSLRGRQRHHGQGQDGRSRGGDAQVGRDQRRDLQGRGAAHRLRELRVATIDKAVEVARRVEGVKSVKNDMVVKGK